MDFMGYSTTHGWKVFACCLATIAVAGVVNAEMCKWMDENGCVHYAETCPEDVEGTKVELQAPPSPEQVDEAAKRFSDEQPKLSEQEEMLSEPAEISTVKIHQMRGRCIKASLSLEVLSKDLPIYYDSFGQLQAELWNYPHVRLERSSSYLNADAKKRALKQWNRTKQDNCTSAVSGSGIRKEVRRQQKEHQQRVCDIWKTELEYMERNKSFHEERLDLKKLFNSKCK